MKKTIFLFSLLIIGCNALKKAEYRTDLKKLSTKSLINEIEKRSPNFNFIVYRAQATLAEENSTNQFNIGIRIKENEKILISGSLLIPLFKGLLTRDQISYYEKISRSYYKGSYASFSKKFNQELTLRSLQNLIIGLPIIKLTEKKWKQTIKNQTYSLEAFSKKNNVTIRYNFSPINLRLISQSITFNNNQLMVKYGKYKITKGKLFPQEIEIFLSSGSKELTTSLNLKINKLGSPVSFPFKIPKGYKPIKL